MMAKLLSILFCNIAILAIAIESSRAIPDPQITKQEVEFELSMIQFLKNESERISKKLEDEKDSLWKESGEIYHIVVNNSDVARVNEVMEDSLVNYETATLRCHKFFVKSLKSFIQTVKQAFMQSLTVVLDAMKSNLESLLQDLENVEDSFVDYLDKLRGCKQKDPTCIISSPPISMTRYTLEYLSNLDLLRSELSGRALTLLRNKVLPALLDRGVLDYVYNCKEESDDHYSKFLPVVRDALSSEVGKLLEQAILNLSSRLSVSSRKKRI